MPTHILRIDASARTTGSVSRDLSDRIIERFTANGETQVTTRDLANPLPLLTETWIGANFTPADDRSPEQAETLALSDTLIDEIKAADVLVKGLLTGKRAIVAVASGGTEMGSDIDFATGYIRHVLGFIGITDVVFVAADRLMLDADATLASAHAAVENLQTAA